MSEESDGLEENPAGPMGSKLLGLRSDLPVYPAPCLFSFCYSSYLDAAVVFVRGFH